MGQIADDSTDAGLEYLTLHQQGLCDEIECPYCDELSDPDEDDDLDEDEEDEDWDDDEEDPDDDDFEDEDEEMEMWP